MPAAGARGQHGVEVAVTTAATLPASASPTACQPMRRMTGSRPMRKYTTWPISENTASLAPSLSAGSPVASSQMAHKRLCVGSKTPA